MNEVVGKPRKLYEPFARQGGVEELTLMTLRNGGDCWEVLEKENAGKRENS